MLSTRFVSRGVSAVFFSKKQSVTATTKVIKRCWSTIRGDTEAFFDRFPQQFCKVNGETLAYVDCQPSSSSSGKEAKHTITLLPGYGLDASIMAAAHAYLLEEDHRIIAISPRGFGDSTQHSEVWNHLDHAKDALKVLDFLGIEKTMTYGISTGGAIAAGMVLMDTKSPTRIQAAFMVSSVPLDGIRTPLFSNVDGSPIPNQWATTVEDFKARDKFILAPALHEGNKEKFFGFLNAGSMLNEKLPEDDPLLNKWFETVNKQQSRVSAQSANASFNMSPIQTPMSPPSDALKKLKAPLIIIHGSKDFAVNRHQVQALVQLAIAEGWAPLKTDGNPSLSYYEVEGGGHLMFYDDPEGVREKYLLALQEQVLCL